MKKLVFTICLIIHCVNVFAQDMVVHIDSSLIQIPTSIIDSVDFNNDNSDKIIMENIIDGGVVINGQQFKFGGDSYKSFIVNKDGSGDYSSLTECISAAIQSKNSKVVVEDGIYDIEQEFLQKYGTDFFANYTSASIKGIVLSNDICVEFAKGAKVIFNYTGDNDNVKKYFSPFNAGREGTGFTLKNANIECSNCRYCVHDERGSDDYSYTNNYIGCNMYMNNSNNSAWNSVQCIGGGLGIRGYIVVDGCTFESVITYGREIVSWHNSASPLAENKLRITNNYFKGLGTFKLSWYGTSTKITEAFVSGNRFGAAIIHRKETADSMIENTRLYDWNNVVE